MADVKIIDIDNEQWNIKDLPLTQRVSALAQEMNEQVENITNEITSLNNAVKGGAIIVVQVIGLAGTYTRVDGFGININLRNIPTNVFQSDGTIRVIEGVEIRSYGVSNGITFHISGDVRSQFAIGSIHLMY